MLQELDREPITKHVMPIYTSRKSGKPHFITIYFKRRNNTEIPPKKTVYFNTNMTCSEQLPASKGPFSCAMSGKLIQVDFTVFATDPPFNHQPSHTMTAVYPFSISCIKHIIKILKMRTGHNPYENWTDRMLVVCRHTLLFNIHYNEQKNSKNKESKFSTCFTLISAVSLTA